MFAVNHQIGFAAGGGFEALAFPNPVLILESEKGITLNGSDVSQWDDRSPEGNHISEGTAANQPAFVTGVVNGFPVVRFDGVDERLFRSSITTTFTDWSFYIVMDVINKASDFDRIFAWGVASGQAKNTPDGWEMLTRSNDANLGFDRDIDNGGDFLAISIAHASGFYIAELHYNSSTPDAEARINGSSPTTDTSDTSEEANPGFLCVGDTVNNGSPQGSNCEVDIACIYQYASLHGSADQSTIRNALAAKYGIALV